MMIAEDKLKPEERLRLECLAQAVQLYPVFLNLSQGNTSKARGEVLSLAKRFETFVTKGVTMSSADGVIDKD